MCFFNYLLFYLVIMFVYLMFPVMSLVKFRIQSVLYSWSSSTPLISFYISIKTWLCTREFYLQMSQSNNFDGSYLMILFNLGGPNTCISRPEKIFLQQESQSGSVNNFFFFLTFFNILSFSCLGWNHKHDCM